MGNQKNTIRHRFYTARTWGNPTHFPMLDDLAMEVQSKEDPREYRSLGYKISRFIQAFNRSLNKFSASWRYIDVMLPEGEKSFRITHIDVLEALKLKPDATLAKLLNLENGLTRRIETLEHFLFLHREKTVKENLPELNIPEDLKADLKGYTRLKTRKIVDDLKEAYQKINDSLEAIPEALPTSPPQEKELETA